MTPRLPSGLQLRDGRWYFECRHQRLRGGRMAISLRCEEEELDKAIQRRAAVVTLMDRGDWATVDRLRRGEIHITDVVAAVREADYQRLRRTGTHVTMLGEAVDRFLQRTEATRARKTYRQYAAQLNLLVGEFGRDFLMEEMTIQRAEEWLHGPKETAMGETWSPSSQKGHRIVYQALWDMAIKDEAEAADRARVEPRLTRNPWRHARTPEVRQTRNVFLTPAEWIGLLNTVRGTPVAALLGLAFRAGLRQSEIRHLRTEPDLILDGPEPLVRIQGREGKHAWTPKTENAQRDVPIFSDLVEILEEHTRRGYAGDRYLVRVPGKDQPISASTSIAWTKKAYERAGIQYGREGEGLTLHSGRHTFASWLAQDGVPLNHVAELLGDTLQVVSDTYAHLVPDTLRTAAEAGYRKVRKAEAEVRS